MNDEAERGEENEHHAKAQSARERVQMPSLCPVNMPVSDGTQIANLTPHGPDSASQGAERLAENKEASEGVHTRLLLHQSSELCAVLLHHLHRGLHLALPALLASLNLLANLLQEFRVLLKEGNHHLPLALGHILHLPVGVFLQ